MIQSTVYSRFIGVDVAAKKIDIYDSSSNGTLFSTAQFPATYSVLLVLQGREMGASG